MTPPPCPPLPHLRSTPVRDRSQALARSSPSAHVLDACRPDSASSRALEVQDPDILLPVLQPQRATEKSQKAVEYHAGTEQESRFSRLGRPDQSPHCRI